MKVEFEFDAKKTLRWLLAALLVWAALGKIANLQEFHANVAAYRLPLPAAMIRMAVMVVPWLELLCGILLVAGTMRRAALLCALGLCAVFVLATGQAWVRGLEISCGCFKLDFLGEGAAKQVLESVQFAFGRAVLLLAAAVWLFRTWPSPSAVVENPPQKMLASG
jgi:uncharacterized membrane protein YphA (DoxX/SURF4 family)